MELGLWVTVGRVSGSGVEIRGNSSRDSLTVSTGETGTTSRGSAGVTSSFSRLPLVWRRPKGYTG